MDPLATMPGQPSWWYMGLLVGHACVHCHGRAVARLVHKCTLAMFGHVEAPSRTPIMPPKASARAVDTIIHQSFEGPSDLLDGVSDTILDYVSLRFNCCTSYRSSQNSEQGMIKYGARIRARTAYKVWESASAGNAEDCLELGLR
jgi:hypothetical protein